MASSTLAMAGTSRTIGHLYDPEGRESEVAFPDAQKFWTKRDGLGRATDVYQGPLGSTSTIMVAFAYNPASQLSYFARRFGDNSAYQYDGAGRLAARTDGFGAGIGNTQSSYLYNPAGQLAGETRSNDAYAWTGSVAVSRNYAANGQNQYTGTVSNGSTSATFTHDANGNLISDGSTGFLYDVENRLVSASGAKNASLAYDPLGRLVQVSSATGVTQFLYDGDELAAEYNGSGTMLRRYVHGDGSDDPLFWYEGAGFDQPRFPHVDRQGSVTATAGPGATPLWINTYDEYGIPGTNNQGRFQYTGQAWLPELGMCHYKARIYSPTLGRFLQVDPIGYEDQINLYAYVANDPVNHADPTGEERYKFEIDLSATFGIGADTKLSLGVDTESIEVSGSLEVGAKAGLGASASVSFEREASSVKGNQGSLGGEGKAEAEIGIRAGKDQSLAARAEASVDYNVRSDGARGGDTKRSASATAGRHHASTDGSGPPDKVSVGAEIAVGVAVKDQGNVSLLGPWEKLKSAWRNW